MYWVFTDNSQRADKVAAGIGGEEAMVKGR
jgi:hypothetical protein